MSYISWDMTGPMLVCIPKIPAVTHPFIRDQRMEGSRRCATI